MEEKDSGNWAVSWKRKIAGDVAPEWIAFAKSKALGLMGLSQESKHFSRKYTMYDGTMLIISGAQQFGRWMVELYCSGVGGGRVFYPIYPELELRPLLVAADKAMPAWPPFSWEYTAGSSTYTAWRFYYRDKDGNEVNAGTDSGTLTPVYIDTGNEFPDLGNYYNNWPEAGWLLSGLGGGGGAFPTSITSIPFSHSPTYVAAYASYVAHWSAYQLSLGERKIRVYTGWGEELVSTSPYGDTYVGQTNMDKEKWSGGDYLQLWSYPYVQGQGYDPLNWTKDDRLIFVPPVNTSVPTEEFGWNSEYPIPSVAIRTVVSEADGRFYFKYGLQQHGPIEYSRINVDGVAVYTNYPDGFRPDGWFTQLLNGNTVDGVSSTSIDEYAEANGYTRGPDPWAEARAEWNAARAAAPDVFRGRQARYLTDQLLTALENGELPDYARRIMRLRPESSRRLVASGDPTLSVTRTHVTSDDGLTTTYTYSLVFAYGSDSNRISSTWTGQRVDRESTHNLKRYGTGETTATLTVLTQSFFNWCNVTADSDPVNGRRLVGGQYNEPGTGYAGMSLDIYDKASFWIDGTSSDEEAQPLFAVVNGVRAFVTDYEGTYDSYTPVMPYSTTGNSQGYFDVPLPYPTIAAANPDRPYWFTGVPDLEVTTLPAYVTYRGLHPPRAVPTNELVYGPPGYDGSPPQIINDPSFLDTRPSKDVVMHLYVSTTSSGESAEESLFPVETSDRSNTMTLRHVYAYAYTYVTGEFAFLGDVLESPYTFPAYPPGVPHVAALVVGAAPPSDVGEYFSDAEEEQYKRFPQYQYLYADPTIIRLDDGTATDDNYTHLSDYLEADPQPFEPQYPNPSEYRLWAVQAWYYRQLLAVPLVEADTGGNVQGSI
ncbi:MAG: hypothetical protein QG602_3447 [Verrucomicrobiota bacterium]|nr:hypothetical protein [Verrucomicrobiota bacterium]